MDRSGRLRRGDESAVDTEDRRLRRRVMVGHPLGVGDGKCAARRDGDRRDPVVVVRIGVRVPRPAHSDAAT